MAKGEHGKKDRDKNQEDTIMRIGHLLVLTFFLFVFNVSSIEMQPDDKFIVDNITYQFNDNLSLANVKINDTTIWLNEIPITIKTNESMNLTIHKFINEENFNLSYNCSDSCRVSFQIGSVNAIRYYIDGDDIVSISTQVTTVDDLFPSLFDNGFMFIPLIAVFLILGTALFSMNRLL